MKKVFLTSSSFLFPKNISWSILENNYKLSFGQYNDIFDLHSINKNIDFKVIAFFFKDFFLNSNDIHDKEKINFFIDSLQQKLKNSSTPVLFFYSYYFKVSIIKDANLNLKEYHLFQYFLKNLKKIKLQHDNFYFFDLDKEFGLHGFIKCFDRRNWYIGRCNLTSFGLEILAQAIFKVLNRIQNTNHKVLVLDCDNTLWGGVAGEDSLSKIILGNDGYGSTFVDFQKSLKKLSIEGILLVLCSKNNENDIWNIFDNHKSMILNKKDIVTHRINWSDKSKNIIDISKELDLALDSFVFWDDNPIEREKVKVNLPQVLTVDVPSDTSYWSEELDALDCFAKFKISKEDLNKVKQYKIRSKFIKDKTLMSNEALFLKKIKLKAELIEIDKSTISRASQLTLKTNQFNISCKKYSVSELDLLKKENNCNMFLVNLKDIYGDHGLVGLLIYKKLENKNIFLDTFLLSCRVLGRYLETWMLNQIFIKNINLNDISITTRYVQNKRNQQVKLFLTKHGFKMSKDLKNKKNESHYYLKKKESIFNNINVYE
jgi:FkbH-like protein